MLNNGLLDEVKNLSPFKNLNALQTVGYKELFDHLEGKVSLDNAIEQIKINTRHYAKRQMTWFKKDEGVEWYNPSDINAIQDIINKKSTNN
jgi:tRNA dimethylallyltransferase